MVLVFSFGWFCSNVLEVRHFPMNGFFWLPERRFPAGSARIGLDPGAQVRRLPFECSCPVLEIVPTCYAYVLIFLRVLFVILYFSPANTSLLQFLVMIILILNIFCSNNCVVSLSLLDTNGYTNE